MKDKQSFALKNNHDAKASHPRTYHSDLVVRIFVWLVILWTHAIGGLSENDFIMAAKIEKIEAE